MSRFCGRRSPPTAIAGCSTKWSTAAANSGLALFNDNPVGVNDPVKASDGGNGFLMNRGYTLVWSGWQGDVAPGGGRMTFLAACRARHHRACTRGFHLRS